MKIPYFYRRALNQAGAYLASTVIGQKSQELITQIRKLYTHMEIEMTGTEIKPFFSTDSAVLKVKKL